MLSVLAVIQGFPIGEDSWEEPVGACFYKNPERSTLDKTLSCFFLQGHWHDSLSICLSSAKDMRDETAIMLVSYGIARLQF
jgi:hypothetical protein